MKQLFNPASLVTISAESQSATVFGILFNMPEQQGRSRGTTYLSRKRNDWASLFLISFCGLSMLFLLLSGCAGDNIQRENADNYTLENAESAFTEEPQHNLSHEEFQALIDEQATPGKKKELLATIAEKEAQVLQATGITPQNEQTARNLVNRYHEFATLFPAHENAPEYLFRAADVLRGLESHIRAVHTLQRLEKEHPDHRHVPKAVFLQGFIYDAFLNQPDMARRHLETFIERYPGHELEASARNMLESLDASPEDLIRRFRNENPERDREL